MNRLRIPALARVTLLLAALSLLFGCGGGLELKLVNSAQKKPNNVWMFFSVQDGSGEPVAGLTAEDFVIYEDGEVVSTFESQQTIQNPEIAAVMYTLLLLDMSGSITESGEVDALVDTAKAFTERVGKSQKVGVYAFDGEEKIHPIVPFTEAPGTAASGIERLRSYKPKDPSTNMHGAVVEGLAELHKALQADKRPLKFGTLVMFSDGTDRANRVSRDEMKEGMSDEKYEHYEMFAIGVGAEIAKAKLDDIGRNGTELATDQAKVKEAFEKVAARIEAHMKRFYLLSYCTPSRKGEHEVTVEAKRKEPAQSGSVKYSFDSSGFGPPPTCDPKAPPAFDMKNIPAEGGPGGSPDASVSVKAGK